jgi:xanthosine utilization system XapX-like protein
MVKRRRRRPAPPKRTLIGPLAMLAGGALAGAMLWRLLTFEPAAPGWRAPQGEQLSQHDRQVLERLLEEQQPRQ